MKLFIQVLLRKTPNHISAAVALKGSHPIRSTS